VSTSATKPTDEGFGRRGRVAATVAASVDKVPNVERSAGLLVSTLYPRGRIEGVVLSKEQVSVHIVVDSSGYGDDLRDIGNSVSRAAEKALRALGDSRPVVVQIDDLLASDARPDSVS
jgi:hypothetical protein